MAFHNHDTQMSATGIEAYRALAKKILDDRRRRADFLPISLFSESAWDAALILFCGEPGLLHFVRTLAERLQLPVTVMARWIVVLKNEGLIEEGPSALNPADASVYLSQPGRVAIRAYLQKTSGLHSLETTETLR